MVTSSNYGAISPVASAPAFRAGKDRSGRARIVSSLNKYDSVTLSTAPEGESRFHMDLVSRMSQDVRTSTTTGNIQALRREVASGTYAPDPMSIAARMLFLGEG